MTQIWGALLIFIVCPLVGGFPLIAWITHIVSGKTLTHLGTGNISVSAAFYHGGKIAGILAVLSEASKGILAVLLARAFFAPGSVWEIIALIALVLGRYFIGKGAGTTNVTWGYFVHDPVVASLTFLLGGIGFTILRERQLGKYGVLVLFPFLTVLLHSTSNDKIIAATTLALLLGWIYQQIPDDLDLSTSSAKASSQVFRYIRGDKSILSLNDELDAAKVGQKAATLSQLKRWGYSVPMGWVLPPGDDPQALLEFLQPSHVSPLIVRSSAIGEDSEQASAAGQYESVANVRSQEELLAAISTCLASYDSAIAIQYRQQRNLPEAAMAVLIQQQIKGVFSGVAFSRDPITQQGDGVIIEALPGNASQVVSGQVTPEQYRVVVEVINADSLQVEGAGDVPPTIIKQVAILARQLENRYHGIPQDIEWSYDGQTLWLLQSRPITTLLPIWTRKIAAEVIPGLIRPLTWSINRPLTCGVWGEIFTIVLGKRAVNLDFNETADLHYSRAYFNASLLGEIFRRMGLPTESLEFLTRGAKFTKPPLNSTLQNIPGLLRLLGRELQLQKDFQRDYRAEFAPALSQFAQQPLETLTATQLLARIDVILALLKRATYYSILAPLSAALRQAVLRSQDGDIDNSLTPEVAALRELSTLAATAREILPAGARFEELELTTEGRRILAEFESILQRFGYLSEVGTDIAVPTWREEPQAVRDLFVQLMVGNEPRRSEEREGRGGRGAVQRRVDLKGRVTEVYSRLLAELRWCFVALEGLWLRAGMLRESGDIFFLEFAEVRRVVAGEVLDLISLVELRKAKLEQDSQLDSIPPLFYGNEPPLSTFHSALGTQHSALQGIPASPGQVEGRVKVMRSLQSASEIDRDTILVVPYTDSGWVAVLARVGGLISEVGGRLSHGAIVAREYGIPAVMDIPGATTRFQDGQLVRIDGSTGIVETINNN